MESNKNWIQSAVNSKHKGYCTPMTKPTCTPERKKLAKRFKVMATKKHESGAVLNFIQESIDKFKKGGGLTRKEDYGSDKKPYPSVEKKDFVGGGRSYPIPTIADARDALKLAGLHNRPDVKEKVYKKYPELKKYQNGGTLNISNIISQWKK